MKIDIRNYLILFLMASMLMLVAFFCGGCYSVSQSDFDRVEAVALSALKRNVRLITQNDSLEIALSRCNEHKLYRSAK